MCSSRPVKLTGWKLMVWIAWMFFSVKSKIPFRALLLIELTTVTTVSYTHLTLPTNREV